MSDPVGPIAVTYSNPDPFRPEAGNIVITEIMNNPETVEDTLGEWFEVYNPTDEQIYLGGCTFSDNGSDTFTVEGDLFIASGEYIVFCCAEDGVSGVISDYVYSGFTLSNDDDEIILNSAEGSIMIDLVEYDGGSSFPDPIGASMQLDPEYLNTTANNDGANWSESTDPIGNGNYGTPGAANTNP